MADVSCLDRVDRGGIERRIIGATIMAVASLAIGLLATPRLLAAGFSDGQKVEVREGDAWSPATIVKHEGRRFQIHYDGGDASSDEWVTAERLRAGDTGTATPAMPVKQPTTTPAVPKEVPFTVGQKIEVKKGGSWEKATVTRKQNAWTLVTYERSKWKEWVEPYRIRKLGSTEDSIGFAKWNPIVQNNEGPPSPQPPSSIEEVKSSKGSDTFAIPADEGVAGLPVTPADRSSVKALVLTEPAATQPAPDNAPVKLAARSAGLHTPATHQEAQLTLNPLGAYAAVSYVARGTDETVVNFERCDLSGGQSGSVAGLAPRVRVMAISPDGSRLLTRSDKFFGGTKWRLDVWSIDSFSSPKALLSFRPFEGDDNAASIDWAQFLDNDRVLTCSSRHQVVLWRLGGQSPSAIYTINAEGMIPPVLSSGGKYLLLASEKMIFVCDSATGEAMARLPAEDAPGGTMALRSDARRLAMIGQRRLVVWDLASGLILNDIGLPPAIGASDVDWVADDLVLIDHIWLLDLKHQAIVWQYDRAGVKSDTVFRAGRLWYAAAVNDSKQLVLASAPVPDLGAVSALNVMTPADALVQPGTKVSLELQMSVPDDERQKIVDHFTRQLQANGVIVVDAQPVKLVASTAPGKSQEVQYRHMGRPIFTNGSEKVTVTPTKYQLAFEADGKNVWQIDSVSGFAPMMLQIKEGQTLEQAVAEQTKPTFGWFLSRTLPKVVLKPSEPLALGKSTLTAAGARVDKGK